ncbi:MAG: hypothetical protein JST92_24460, partial [Deltaproteobacteria bacterium]|nr:hypothetical protein [Deltaproteobacteria bacterium]
QTCDDSNGVCVPADPVDDAGTTGGTDAGSTGGTDAGTGGTDAGTHDGGTGGTDAGTHDGGTGGTDAGTHDGGTGGTDAGTGGTDAGTGGTDAGSACTPDTWTNYASAAFSTNCKSCHSWATKYTSVKSRQSSCQTDISTGAMPKNHALSSSDKSRLVKWLSCGLPQ